MKKLLICLLLLANLSSGLAFALDSHPETVVGHDSTAPELLVGEDHDYPEGEPHHKDHSCHGAAHLIALFSSQAMPLVASGHNGFASLLQTPTHLYIAPLLRPPIA